MIRLDTQASTIVSINTVANTNVYPAQSIVAITNSEVFYSFGETGSSTHHLVIANFTQSDATTFWLNETYHATISKNSTHGSVSRLSHDITTLWHAVNLDTYISYFQLNLTDNSIIGSKNDQTNAITSNGLSMEVSQEVV